MILYLLEIGVLLQFLNRRKSVLTLDQTKQNCRFLSLQYIKCNV